MTKKNATYLDAGVNIDEGNRFVDLIKPIVKTTMRPEVTDELGGFGALFKLDLTKYKKPVLVSATDGVGTKLKVAFMANRHETVGIDLVAMSVNDLVVQGAEPLFFLDYFATGLLSPEDAAKVIEGVAEGCKQAGCALIGGETAEMPGFYQPGEYDLAGFAVGIVDEENVITGRTIEAGDKVFGLASNGLHSNGYSLVRKIVFEQNGLSPDAMLPKVGTRVAETLLAPTKIYAKACLKMAETGYVKGFSHITGGGFFDNIPRVLPEGVAAHIDRTTLPKLPIFEYLQEAGPVEEREMYRTFNMGIGMVVIAKEENKEALTNAAQSENEPLIEIGTIEATGKKPHVVLH